MWVVPKPLSDTTLSEGKGRKFSYFGYEFDAPWTDVKEERKLESMAIVNFSGGAVVTILDPVGSLDELQVLKQEAAKNGMAVEAVFGEDATRSNYMLRSKILNLTPKDLRLFLPRQEMVGDSILLLFKSIWTKRIKGGVFLSDPMVSRISSGRTSTRQDGHNRCLGRKRSQSGDFDRVVVKCTRSFPSRNQSRTFFPAPNFSSSAAIAI
jgi:hypothetical protein